MSGSSRLSALLKVNLTPCSPTFSALRHLGVIEAVMRVGLGLERVEGPDHVLGRDRAAVLEMCLGAQIVLHPAVIPGHLHAFGDEPVFRARLVIGGGHQRVEEQGEAGRLVALELVGVEGVEGADRGVAHAAALGRVGIDVSEILEIGAVFQIAEQREAVALCDTVIGGDGGGQSGDGGKHESGNQSAHGGVSSVSHGRQSSPQPRASLCWIDSVRPSTARYARAQDEVILFVSSITFLILSWRAQRACRRTHGGPAAETRSRGNAPPRQHDPGARRLSRRAAHAPARQAGGRRRR